MGDIVIGVVAGVWLAGIAFLLFVADDRDSLLGLMVALLWPLALAMMAAVEFVDWVRFKMEAPDGDA